MSTYYKYLLEEAEIQRKIEDEVATKEFLGDTEYDYKLKPKNVKKYHAQRKSKHKWEVARKRYLESLA